MTPTRTHAEWTYPATLQNVDRTCAAAASILNLYTLSAKDRFALELLMREALNNAVIHGCGRRAEKTFTCQLMVSESAVTLEIADDGTGFDWRTVLCTGCDSTLEGGRGMPIYRLYASSVTFNDPGNCVTLKRIVEGGIDARHTDHAE